MKKYRTVLITGFGALWLQGCIAFPPLLQVQHRHEAPPPAAVAPATVAPAPSGNDEVLKRLDAIDRRLEHLEKGQAH